MITYLISLVTEYMRVISPRTTRRLKIARIYVRFIFNSIVGFITDLKFLSFVCVVHSFYL